MTIPHTATRSATVTLARGRGADLELSAALHERLQGLSVEAVGLWLEGLIWLDEHDGDVIPAVVVGRSALASELVRNGLWDDGPDEGSWRMLLYEPDWRPTGAA
jgi:hypothetical protein